MKTIILNGHKVEFYDDINELPIIQMHKYSRYLLVDGGIGDSLSSIDAHITKILELMSRDVEKATKEIMNLRQNLYLVLTEQDLSHKSILCLVKSVDNEEWKDFSDSGIEKLYCLLRGEKERKFMELKEELGKAIDSQLQTYFPDIFDDSQEKNYCDLLRKRAYLQIAHITEGKDVTEEMNEVTTQILRYYQPKTFSGKESAEVEFDKHFEDMCLVLSREYGTRVKDYSVMEFYTAYSRMEKEHKEMEKLKHR